ncbi:MAG: antibiotic biosynthesis monooxygenase [Nitrospirae bacterium]|nr:antibiotic biosynthesis monooxygenase [Nitrospirota bacterium]
MIIVTLRIIVQHEKQSDFLAAMRGMLEPARVERGCLNYCLLKNIENNNAFVLFEEWETQEDLESHISTDNQRQLVALMDSLGENIELRFNTVSHTAGIELMENVLKR